MKRSGIGISLQLVPIKKKFYGHNAFATFLKNCVRLITQSVSNLIPSFISVRLPRDFLTD